MRKNILILALVIALIGVGYWGVKTNRILTQWQLQTENQYKNAFQELNIHLDSMEEEMATALVTKANERRLVKLNNIWRDAYAAQEDMGELPIAGVSLVEFKNLLARVERYTYQLSKDHVTGDLSAKDWENLNKLHTQIEGVASDLEETHDKMERKNFRWSKQRHIILEKKDLDKKSALGSLHTLEQNLKSSEVELGLNKEPANRFLLQLNEIKDDKIKNDEAIDIVKDFLGARSKKFDFRLAEDQVENENIITVIAEAKEAEDDEIFFDVSRRGNVIWFLERRDFGENKIDSKKARKFAKDFINQIDYGELAIKDTESSGGIVEVEFVPKTKGVLIYPRPIIVKVARDNGNIVGFNARKYLANKDLKVDLESQLSLEETKERVNKRLDLQGNRLVVINTDRKSEALCREFTGKLKGDTFKVYINADNGREEKVDRIKKAD